MVISLCYDDGEGGAIYFGRKCWQVVSRSFCILWKNTKNRHIAITVQHRYVVRHVLKNTSVRIEISKSFTNGKPLDSVYLPTTSSEKCVLSLNAAH
jgi:hypothetical protein